MLVLKDQVITTIFKNLTRTQIASYQDTLIKGLLEYENDHSIIPPRIVTATPYCTHLFMASTGTHVGMKAISSSKKGLLGITTILDKLTGYPLAVINGATLTAFRTALCSTLALTKCFPVNDNISYDNSGEVLIVYGVGDQAVWHVRLTLILYPNRFKNVIIVNRTLSKAAALCQEFTSEFENAESNSNVEFLPIGSDDKGLIDWFVNATVVFSCVPTTSPTVLKKEIDKCEKRVFIGAIGSYKPHMIEIEGELMKSLVLENGGKIIVDSSDHCLEEAGEFLQNDIKSDSLIDISEIYAKSSENSDWISKSKVVVCKLVGLCIMDVWVGTHVMEKATEMGAGITIDDF